MSDVVLSRGIRSNLLSLQNASGLQEIAQNRLATGRKVNNALDDPLNFFQSQNLSTSAKDLGRLLDNMGLGLETLKKTDATLVSMTRLIEQMQAGLRTALTSASTVSRLASGMNPTTTRAIDYITNPNIVGTSAPGSPGAFPATATMTINFSVPSSPTIAHAAAGPPAGGFTVAFTNPMTAQQLRDAINANAANNNTTTGERYVNAVIDAGGRLTIENTTSGSLQIVMGGAGLPANPLGALFGTFEPPLPTSTTSDTGVITATTNPDAREVRRAVQRHAHADHQLRQGCGLQRREPALWADAGADLQLRGDHAADRARRRVRLAGPRLLDHRHAPQHAVRHRDQCRAWASSTRR